MGKTFGDFAGSSPGAGNLEGFWGRKAHSRKAPYEGEPLTTILNSGMSVYSHGDLYCVPVFATEDGNRCEGLVAFYPLSR